VFRWIHCQRILLPTFLVGALLFLGGCNKGFTLKIEDQDIFAFGAQDSCNFITATVLSNTLRVSWKSDTPVNLVITPSVPEEFDTEILSAADKWNSTLGKNLIHITRDNSFSAPPASDRVNAIYWSTEWDSDQASQQARTAIRWDVSKLLDTDIRVNAKNFIYYKNGDTNKAGKIHLESLLVHELGHALGLSHIADLASVMQTHLKSETSRNQPGAVDSDSLKCEY